MSDGSGQSEFLKNKIFVVILNATYLREETSVNRLKILFFISPFDCRMIGPSKDGEKKKSVFEPLKGIY